MPDGSRHAAYNKINSSYYITKDYWLLDINCNPPVLTLTNGTKIYYGQGGPPHPDYPAHTAYYATKIQDVNGNEINIYYQSSGSNLISYVIDSVGRTVNFTTTAINSATRLVSISGPGVSISYTHKSLPTQGHTVLTEARPPVGNPWKYTYNESLFWLTQITTPSGGIIEYTYSVVNVNMGFPFYYWGVTKKVTSSTIPSGTWTFAYSQGPYKDYTQISDPCGRTIKYSYYGYGSGLPNGSMWMIGLPKSKEIVGEETVTYDWARSSAISYDDYKAAYIGIDNEIYVPLLTRKSVTRDGKAYVTNYSDYDAYANPQTISEAGDKTRNRVLTYWYNTSKNIVQNKPASETVSGGFPGTFTTTYAYDTNTGSLLQVNRYGVLTSYTYYANGNLEKKTDANGNTTTYEWSNGRISKIINPIYSISRTINPNGTIASETNGRGFTTAYTYDGNLRLTRITPPVGNPTIFTYPADNSYKDETRGGFNIRHYNDGFGRPTGSTDTKGITTTITYKACGPKNYSISNIGDTIYYDNFGRVTQIIHKDNTKITYAYSQGNVSVTDEASHTTLLTYHAFGDPEEKLLVSVPDALNNTTSYNYNILGSLTNITQGSLSRAFSYNSKNFLISETHPERGNITYGRDNMGNMTSKTDGLGTTSYTYDALHRLLSINYGAGTITFTYDNADNRTSMINPSAVIGYEYDSANRLTRKTETIRGRAYYTDYRYDGNDNLTDIYYPPSGYPSGRRVRYTYNSNNQVTSIPGFVTNINYYTSGTSTGLPSNITYANNIATSLSYNLRNLTTQINGGTALNIGYGYADNRGNMTSISDYLDASKNQTFTYDGLNRLRTFNGPWGTGSFTYDSRDNRLTKTVAGGVTNYNYTNNRLTSTSGVEPFSFTYNSDGDAVNINGFTLQYDRLHNLLSYKKGSNSIADFTYDGDGMRVTKTSGGKTTVYHYDKEGRILSETEENGALITDYIYLHGKLVAKVVNDTAPPAGSILVNAGAVYTHTAYVTLTLSAFDPQSGVSQMRFSNDGVNWSDWEPYATSKQWTLVFGNGLKTVYVQYRDRAGNISTYVANITLLLKQELVDFDGDRKTDIAIYRKSTGAWYILPSSGNPAYGVGWGGDPSDLPVPGDYDGDGKTDIAIYRVSTGAWYVIPSSGGIPYGVGWGGDASDKPAMGDYDGDGKTDLTVYRRSTGAWYIVPSSGGAPYGVGWGGDSTDKPVPGDYDGDKKTDIAIYRSSTGVWWIRPSGGVPEWYAVSFGGGALDTPVYGDFDGDGKTDQAFYRPEAGVCFILPSGSGSYYGEYFGAEASDILVPGDYDGDGKTDDAFYRPSTGVWYIKPSGGGSWYAVHFGGDPSDIPVTTNRASY